MLAVRLALSAAVVVGCAAAQAVWSMGAPWTDLAVVLSSAAPGDIVLLNGLTFAPFVLTKGLTIIGPGVIRPATTPPVYQQTTLTIPPTERAHIVDVDFLPAPVFDNFTHAVVANGTVAFEDCSFGAGVPNSLLVAGTILVERCTFTPATVMNTDTPAGGMRVQGGVCWITNSSLVGAPGHFYSGFPYVIAPTTALLVASGTVYVANTTLNGGNGYANAVFGTPVPGAAAMLVQLGSASLTDCTGNGGSSPANLAGAQALATTGGTASYARSTLSGGAGNPPGPPSTGAVAPVSELVGMAMAQPFQLGLTTQLIATAGTSQLLGMFAAFDPTTATHAIVLGPFLATPLIPLLAAAPLPGAQVAHAVIVPNQPTLLGATVFAQAFQLDGAFVRASAVVGGAVH